MASEAQPAPEQSGSVRRPSEADDPDTRFKPQNGLLTPPVPPAKNDVSREGLHKSGETAQKTARTMQESPSTMQESPSTVQVPAGTPLAPPAPPVSSGNDTNDDAADGDDEKKIKEETR